MKYLAYSKISLELFGVCLSLILKGIGDRISNIKMPYLVIK